MFGYYVDPDYLDVFYYAFTNNGGHSRKPFISGNPINKVSDLGRLRRDRLKAESITVEFEVL